MRRTKVKLIWVACGAALFSLSVWYASPRVAADARWKERSRIPLPSHATTLAYSLDGGRIATGHADGSINIWDTKTGALVHSLKAHAGEVKIVQFTAQDTLLLSLGEDHRAHLWAVNDWMDKGTIEDVAFSCGASPDGRWLACQDTKQTIWLWDLKTLRRVKQLSDSGIGGTRAMSFTADGKYLATAYSSPLIINLETKEHLALVNPGDKKTPLKIEQSGDQVSFSLGKMQDDDAPTHRITTSRTGSLVALSRAWYGRGNAFVDVWDIGAMKRLGRFKPKDGGLLASFSFDNSLLAIDGASNATIWDVARVKQVATLKADGKVLFSPTSLELAATDGNSLIFYVP